MRLLVLVLLVAVPAAGQEGGAAPVPESSEDRTPIRTVTASASQPVVVWARVRTVTTVRLPEGEEILHTVSGDAENWDIVPRGRELNLKPLAAGLVSNITVSCASGRVYTFTVIEDGQELTDYVVTVEREEEQELVALPEDLVEARYLPWSVVEGFEGRLADYQAQRNRILAEGQQQVDRLWFDAERRQRQFVLDFAERVRLPYQLSEEAYEAPFLVREIWTDGTFTYLRSGSQGVPAVYAWADGSPVIVHTDVEPGGLIVVDQVIRHGTLSLDGREAWFGLAEEGGAMPQGQSGFWERNFAAPPRMYGWWGAIGGVLALVWGL